MTEVPQYRRMRCPVCGCYAFSFVVALPEPLRKCHDNGHVFDPGDRGREIIGWRQEQT